MSTWISTPPARTPFMARTAFRAASRSAWYAFNSRLRRLGKFDTSPHIRERNRDTACEQFTRKGIAGNRFAGKPLFAYSDKARKDWIFDGGITHVGCDCLRTFDSSFGKRST